MKKDDSTDNNFEILDSFNISQSGSLVEDIRNVEIKLNTVPDRSERSSYKRNRKFFKS